MIVINIWLLHPTSLRLRLLQGSRSNWPRKTKDPGHSVPANGVTTCCESIVICVASGDSVLVSHTVSRLETITWILSASTRLLSVHAVLSAAFSRAWSGRPSAPNISSEVRKLSRKLFLNLPRYSLPVSIQKEGGTQASHDLQVTNTPKVYPRFFFSSSFGSALVAQRKTLLRSTMPRPKSRRSSCRFVFLIIRDHCYGGTFFRGPIDLMCDLCMMCATMMVASHNTGHLQKGGGLIPTAVSAMSQSWFLHLTGEPNYFLGFWGSIEPLVQTSPCRVPPNPGRSKLARVAIVCAGLSLSLPVAEFGLSIHGLKELNHSRKNR